MTTINDLAALRWLPPKPDDFRERVRATLEAPDRDGKALRYLAGHALGEADLTHLGKAFIRARLVNPQAEWRGLTPFRVAFLSSATTDHLMAPLVATALRYGINLHILGIAYHDAYNAAAGDDDRLRQFAPQATFVAVDYRGLPLREAYGDGTAETKNIDNGYHYIQAMLDGVRNKTGAAAIVQTLASPPAVSFGHVDRLIAGTTARIIDGINHRLVDGARQQGRIIFDVAALASMVGSASWFDPQAYNNAKLPFALMWLPFYADHVCRLLGAMIGKSRRVLVLDLDNTLWGGVVGDDGIEGLRIGCGSAVGEAYLDFQRSVRALKDRGILLAVSSKNDDAQARRPFREIPDMLLNEESFAAFHANWDDKAANIKAIARELSLGLDSFVFVDDNPMERALVRQFLPEVAVPEMPSDPALYSAMLNAAGYFEAVSFSAEDARRADLYRARSALAQVAPHDLGDYLASLDMKLVVERVSAPNRGRVVQLVNKSNQFNLTTRRYTDAEVEALAASPQCIALAFRLTDKFDDHGIISVVFAECQGDVLDITLWVMSCRVIGRGVEKAVLTALIAEAYRLGCSTLQGTYIPTERNQMVEHHYATLGFTQKTDVQGAATVWQMVVMASIPAPPNLTIINNTN